MAALSPEEKQYTIEEYLYKEVRSEWRNEYFNGKIVERKSVALTQALVATNVMAAIHTEVHNISATRLRVVGSGLLVYVSQFNFILYPGAALVFQEPRFLTPEQNVLLNPLLIVETVSASDIEYNHSTRFPYYRTIPSFREYVFVEQDTPFVSCMYKTDTHEWMVAEATGLEASIFLRSINCAISLESIYSKVNFSKHPGNF